MRVKMAVCISVMLLGIGAGWHLNARLAPPTDDHTRGNTAGGSASSRIWQHNEPEAPFKPREYVRIVRTEPEGGQLP